MEWQQQKSNGKWERIDHAATMALETAYQEGECVGGHDRRVHVVRARAHAYAV
jgi:hypothetical protein